MNKLQLAMAAVCLGGMAMLGQAAEISGQYIEARTCDVFTGPCVANAEVGVAGKEGIMAWRIDQGSWKGVELSGLSVAAALLGSDTLDVKKRLLKGELRIKAVVYVDANASASQRAALLDFAKSQSGPALRNVVRVESAPIQLTIDHVKGRGQLKVGEVAKIETRRMSAEDSNHT